MLILDRFRKAKEYELTKYKTDTPEGRERAEQAIVKLVAEFNALPDKEKYVDELMKIIQGVMINVHRRYPEPPLKKVQVMRSS